MRFCKPKRAPAPVGPATTAVLLRFLVGLAWRYRTGCICVLALQLLLLALGLSGLGLMGAGVDFIRYEAGRSALAAAHAAAPTAPAADGTVAATPAAIPKPPRWPFDWTPPPGASRMGILTGVAGAILVLALIRALLNYLYTLEVTRLVQGRIVPDLRTRVYDKMQRLSFRFFDANASSSIINRVTGDVQSVRLFVDGVVMPAIVLLLSLAVYLVYMIRIHLWLTIACLGITPLLWFVTDSFARRMRPLYRQARDRVDDLVLVLNEHLNGIPVVKGFALEAIQERKFARTNAAVRDQQKVIFRLVSFFNPLTAFITQLGLVVLLGYGGWLVVQYERLPDATAAVQAGLSIGELLVFAGLLQQFAGQVANIANIANSVQQSLIAAQRVYEVLTAPVEVESPAAAVRLPRPRGAVSFRQVTFGYRPDDPVLEAIDLEVEPGACIAILGATGAGKSTLMSLIPRFYDPQSGSVCVDGIDVRRLAVDDLRRAVGMVFQESFLFSTTVAANIAFGNSKATRAQIERAAHIAAADTFIRALPKGYDTILHEGGTDLSGGQRQRLAIARAMLLEPTILLLDDPTAAIDAHTEEDILQALESAMAGRTTFVVAHRLSTLRRADRVLVLDRGRIAACGTHTDLMQQVGLYRDIVALQLADAPYVPKGGAA